MMTELIDAFDRADTDDAVRAVIVTGAGRGFCAGTDLSAGAKTFDYEPAPTNRIVGRRSATLAANRTGAPRITPEACLSWFLPRLVGIGQALEWTVTGRVFPAVEAHVGRLVQTALRAGGIVARRPLAGARDRRPTAPVSVALTRQMMWRMLGADHPMEAHKIDSRSI